VRLRTTISPLSTVAPGARVVATAPGGSALVVLALGEGRVAALGLSETWRWRMEAGAIAEHREFWRSMADFLARQPERRVRLLVEPAVPAVGSPVEVRAWSRDGQPVPDAVVREPGGAEARIPLTPGAAGEWRGRYHPHTPGIHEVSAGDASTGFRADTAGRHPDGGWDRAALMAARTGGRSVPAESAGAVIQRLQGAHGSGPWRPGGAFWLAVLVALAAAEWTLRRARGRP
jgi:hypothetical protein